MVEAGADGLLVLPQPYVLKATRDELVRRFDALARAVAVPIVAYNSPRRSGIELTLDDLDAIMNVAPIIGIKEASRDFFHHTHLIERFRERLSIMVGPCHFIVPGLALGAHGYIATGPGAARATGEPHAGARARGPGSGATPACTTSSRRVYEMMMGTGTWPSALKAALNLLGQPAGVPREPVMPLAGADLEKVRARCAHAACLAMTRTHGSGRAIRATLRKRASAARARRRDLHKNHDIYFVPGLRRGLLVLETLANEGRADERRRDRQAHRPHALVDVPPRLHAAAHGLRRGSRRSRSCCASARACSTSATRTSRRRR